MRSLKSLAAYSIAAANMFFASGCTLEQANNTIGEAKEYFIAAFSKDKAWSMLDGYEFIDDGAWKDDLKKNYVDYMKAATMANNYGDESYFRKNKIHVVDTDTLKSSLYVSYNGLMQIDYDLPKNGHAKLVFLMDPKDNAYPHVITVEERNPVTPELIVRDVQSFVRDLEGGYKADYRTSTFFIPDSMDQRTILEASFMNDIADDVGYDVSMTLTQYHDDVDSIKIFDRYGLKSYSLGEDAEGDGLVDSTGTFADFLAAAQQTIHREIQTSDADKIIEDKLLIYKNWLDHMPAKALIPQSDTLQFKVPEDDFAPWDKQKPAPPKSSGTLFKLIALPVQQRRFQM